MDNYPWDQGRTDAERRFLSELERLCGGQGPFDVWTYHPQLVVTATIADPEENAVIRTLRVDFDGQSLLAGNDPSHQIVGTLDPNDPDYFTLPAPVTPTDAAQAAYEWFRHQADLPVDRQEWHGTKHPWRRWVLAVEDERALGGQYTNRPDRPPDRVVRLAPPHIGSG